MIRKALISDIDEVMNIAYKARKIMQNSGNFQWDDKYPLPGHFETDIANGELYIVEHGGDIAGFACFNGDVPDEYSNARWESAEPSLIVHRMAVAPEFRGLGLAGDLLDFAFVLAVNTNVRSIRTDTFAGNIPMNSLFQKHGFKKVGEINLPGKAVQPFCCYEKTVTVSTLCE